MMRGSSHFPAVALASALTAALAGCTQTQWWDDYASKTETMKFLTFVSCDAWFLPTLPEHQVYFHVTAMSDYDDGSYRVEYQRQSQWVYERLYFRSVNYIGLRDYTAISTVWMPPDSGATCAALVVLPWSSGSRRPFADLNPSSLRRAASQNLSLASDAGLWAFAALVLLLILALRGFSKVEGDAKTACVLFSIAAVGLNLSVFCYEAHTLSNIDALASYYTFYEALPKSDGHLLPLSWSQAHRLFDGPPHPTSLVVDDGLYWSVWLSCATWLAMYARRIFIGIAYATMPDPFEELRVRLAAEGRVPTAEEYLSVLMRAGTAMTTWRLQLLERRIKERFPDA